MFVACYPTASASWEPPVPLMAMRSPCGATYAYLEAQKGKTYDEGLIDDFLENVYYLAFDSTNADEYYKLRERIEFLQEKHDLPDKIIYYLATPPVMYEIVRNVC